MSKSSKEGGWGRLVPATAADQEDNSDIKEREASIFMVQDDTAEQPMFQICSNDLNYC